MGVNGAIGVNGGHWVQWGQLGPFGVPFGVRFGVLFGVFFRVPFGVPFGVTVGVPFGVQVVLVDDLEAPVEEGGSHEGLLWGQWGCFGVPRGAALGSMRPLGVNGAIGVNEVHGG